MTSRATTTTLCKQRQQVSHIACGTTYSFFCVLPRLDVSNFKILSDGGSAPRIDFENGSPDRIEVVDNNFGNKKFNTSSNFIQNDSLTSIINASTTVNVFYNGNASSTNPFTIPNANTFNTLGGQTAGGAYEVILYNSDQSDNRTAIEANIGEHYGISGIPAYDNTVDGFVETWYDQSGNGNDATQTVAANQPKIVDAGVFLGEIDFDGSDDFIKMDSEVTLGTEFYVPMVVTAVSADSESNATFMGSDNSGGGDRLYLTTNANLLAYRNNATNYTTSLTPSGTEAELVSYTATSSNMTTSLNGTDDVDAALAGSMGAEYIGGGTGFNLAASFKEIIIYNSDQSSNRTAIEANINNHYSIY
jgi:hypothetical protein